MCSFDEKIAVLKDGAYAVLYQKRRYMLRKETRLHGRLVKLYAYDLGGNDFVSLNYYKTKQKNLLKPCEMDVAKVIDFVLHCHLL